LTPGLHQDRSQAVAIVGPMPGTSSGSRTLIQPMVSEGEAIGLITVSGGIEIDDPAVLGLLRPLAEESALALSRLQALGDERRRLEAMEIANRLAGTRSSEAVEGRALREPVAGRRPEDVVLATAAIRHVAVAPLFAGGRLCTLQAGRREPRAFTASELSLLQLVAERLGLVLAAAGLGAAAGAGPRPEREVAA